LLFIHSFNLCVIRFFGGEFGFISATDLESFVLSLKSRAKLLSHSSCPSSGHDMVWFSIQQFLPVLDVVRSFFFEFLDPMFYIILHHMVVLALWPNHFLSG
jgi:hypothetical protein